MNSVEIAMTLRTRYDLKMGVIGNRSFTDTDLMDKWLHYIMLFYNVTTIISGGRRKDGKGADTLAENWADYNEFDKIIYPPHLKMEGSPQAYFSRNQKIADTSDFVVAFWDEKSTGTLDTLKRVYLLNKIGLIIPYHDTDIIALKPFQPENYK